MDNGVTCWSLLNSRLLSYVRDSLVAWNEYIQNFLSSSGPQVPYTTYTTHAGEGWTFYPGNSAQGLLSSEVRFLLGQLKVSQIGAMNSATISARLGNATPAISLVNGPCWLLIQATCDSPYYAGHPKAVCVIAARLRSKCKQSTSNRDL